MIYVILKLILIFICDIYSHGLLFFLYSLFYSKGRQTYAFVDSVGVNEVSQEVTAPQEENLSHHMRYQTTADTNTPLMETDWGRSSGRTHHENFNNEQWKWSTHT